MAICTCLFVCNQPALELICIKLYFLLRNWCSAVHLLTAFPHQDVQFAGGHAIDAVCSSTSCTTEILLKGIADQGPFPVDFQLFPETDLVTNGDDGSGIIKRPFNGPAYGCNESVPRRHLDAGGPACSCLDCESSCIPPPIPPTPAPWPKIFGLDAWWVGAFFAFAAVVLAFGIFQIATRIYCAAAHRVPSPVDRAATGDDGLSSQETFDDDTRLQPKRRLNCLARLQAKLDILLSRVCVYSSLTFIFICI
ncbi:hypothetical protein P879_10244 [Paragonimus westermani]|uniref:Niemann-Pick C1 N-terminal domain-containing protein n=1 Tax=Paragonimus westermani TaxID=34504 RepID=A0A8T0D303_9TREM|nr:hypothetical protein P879_10244 [Paragonimus westermani]